MTRIKRNLICLLALILLLTGVNSTGLFSTADLLGVKAHAAAKVLKSGSCGANGSNLSFKLYSDGTLVITGKGKMKNFRENKYDCPQTPWGTYVRQREIDNDWDDEIEYDYYDSTIKSVVIGIGVTSVGDLAFKNCIKLSSVSLPKGLLTIYDDAFEGCYGLKKIHYGGTKSQWSKIRIGEDSRETFARAAKSYGSVGKHTHSYKTSVSKKATLSSNGKKTSTCTVCNAKKTSSIAKIASVKLSTTVYNYNGKVKTPSVTVKDSSGKKLVKNTDFKVSYASGRKKAGKYSVKVTFKGKYSGTKALSFKIVKK